MKKQRFAHRNSIPTAVLALVLALFTATVAADPAPVVAAASSLRFALTAVADRFARDTGKGVKLSFGSSGNLRRQIAHGAPYQVFLSADEDYVLDLAREGHAIDRGVVYAEGRIVLWVPHDSPLRVDGELKDLDRAVADGRLRRFAIANPAHAPYGRRAREALVQAEIWQSVKDRLVLGENVSQAAQFAASGSTQGGIIAYSLALSPNLVRLGRYALIPRAWHEPLRQRMALISGAGETARQFYEFLQNETARAILQRYGFGQT